MREYRNIRVRENSFSGKLTQRQSHLKMKKCHNILPFVKKAIATAFFKNFKFCANNFVVERS